MHRITLADSVAIADLKSKNYSYRDLESKLKIPKSTIHYNIETINKTDEVLAKGEQPCRTREFVKVVVVSTMDGKTSSRGLSAMINNIWNTSISHQTIL